MTVSEYEKLAETLEGLAAKATPGPWAPIESNYDDGTFYCAAPRMSLYFHSIEDKYDRCDYGNAALIVTLVNAVPTITAALRECAKRRPEPDEERVARAIYEASIAGEERHHDAWDDIPVPYRGQLFAEARAAIRAMEE